MRLQTHCATFIVFLDIHHEHPHVGFASANLVKLIYFPPFLIKFMDQAKAKRDQDRPQHSEIGAAPGPPKRGADSKELEGTRERNTDHLPSEESLKLPLYLFLLFCLVSLILVS